MTIGGPIVDIVAERIIRLGSEGLPEAVSGDPAELQLCWILSHDVPDSFPLDSLSARVPSYN
ncbi:hypothetical protein [Nocardia testacea]|uniref:hypothetical protein n=1 Tax=Nocardia testacea TaxID=248551 RepID=UPI0033FC9BD0